MNLPVFTEMPLPLSEAESRFRSAVDDLAVFEPPEDTTPDIVRIASKPLSQGRYLLLEVIDPYIRLEEENCPDGLIYSASIVDGEVETATLWLEGMSVYTGTDHWENRVPYELSDQAINDFLDQTGALL